MHFIFLKFFGLGILCCFQNIFLGKTACVMVTESLPDLKITPAAATAKCCPLQFVSLHQHSFCIFSYYHSRLNSYKLNFIRTWSVSEGTKPHVLYITHTAGAKQRNYPEVLWKLSTVSLCDLVQGHERLRSEGT